MSALPRNWKIDRLKDVVPTISGGGTPESNIAEFWEDGSIVWVTPSDFTASDGIGIDSSARMITQAGFDSCATVMQPIGAVVMTSRASIGDARIALTQLCTNQGFISFCCDEASLHNRYLRYQIETRLGPYFAEVAPGTTFKEISRGVVRREPLLLPPTDEQQRIAAYLDASCRAIDAAVAAKREQIATLDVLRECTIETEITGGLEDDKAFAEVGQDWIRTLPPHWEVVRIKRILARMDYGISESTVPDGKFPVLKMGNIQGGEIRFTKIEFVDSVESGLLLEADDILYNRTNSHDQVGKAAIFRGNRDDAVTLGVSDFLCVRRFGSNIPFNAPA